MTGITEEIVKQGGVPNYFGVQRFGDIRPVTHKVGEALARGNIEEAVFIYLALPFPGELDRTRETREKLWVNRDIPAALKEFPEYLRYEVAMLNYLVEHPAESFRSSLITMHCLNSIRCNLAINKIFSKSCLICAKNIQRLRKRGENATPLWLEP
jgi:TruD family tRNA pseudouridine synthase